MERPLRDGGAGHGSAREDLQYTVNRFKEPGQLAASQTPAKDGAAYTPFRDTIQPGSVAQQAHHPGIAGAMQKIAPDSPGYHGMNVEKEHRAGFTRRGEFRGSPFQGYSDNLKYR